MMSGSSSGGSARARPGMFTSHRGRAALRWMIVAAIAAVMFSMVSGLVSGSSASPEQASATPDDLEVVPAIKVPDPVVVAAPADPFAGGGAVELPDGFLPGEDYDAMLAVARQVAATYTTFSARNTPEQFVATNAVPYAPPPAPEPDPLTEEPETAP